MAEGFGSIADLKIVVDATTDKLQSNLASASNLIQRFGSDGNKTLSGFDAILAKTGGAAGALREKFGVLATGITFASGNMRVAAAIGEQFAAKLGMSDDFNRVTESLSDMGAAIEEGLGAAWERATGKASGYFAVAGASDGAAPGVGFSKSAADTAVDGIGQFSHAVRRLGDDSKWTGKTIETEFSLVEDQLNKFAAEARRVSAEGSMFDGLLGTDSIGANIEVVASLLRRVEELNDRRRENAAKNAAAERGQAEALGTAEFEKLVPALEKEITALERKAAALGMTKGEAASYAAVMQVIESLTKNGAMLTEDAALKLGDYAARVRELTEAADAFAKVDQAKKFMDGLDKEVRTLDQQAAAVGKSTAEVAALNAEMRIRNQISDQGLQLGDDEKAKVEETIAAIRSRTLTYAADKKAKEDADRGEKGFEQSLAKLQRETMLLKEKALALVDSSDAGQIKARVDRELADMQARNIPLSEQRIAAIRAEVTAQIEAKRAAEDFQQQMRIVAESGQVVSRTLEGAFSRWTEGAKVDVKDMVRSVLADMAQLTFRRGVIETLFGGGGGGSSGGGLLGSFASSLLGGGNVGLSSWEAGTTVAFAGARAGGGPVDMGKSYLVGERGMELFTPQQSGFIVPNNALGGGGRGGGSVTVSMPIHINAAGAYPESIADIRREIATVQADLPGRVVQVVREAQDRGVA